MAEGINSITVLGIHSNVAGDDADFTGGHAWISVTVNGTTTSYGLWPDKHPLTQDNGHETDIRIGLEGTRFPRASRFYRLNGTQIIRLNRALKKRVTWRYTNTCASWASEIIDEVIGTNIDADDWVGFETPRELGKHILKLEKRNPTSKNTPVVAVVTDSSW